MDTESCKDRGLQENTEIKKSENVKKHLCIKATVLSYFKHPRSPVSREFLFLSFSGFFLHLRCLHPFARARL